MYYFLEENVAITEQQLNSLKISKDWSFLRDCPKDFNIHDVVRHNGKIYDNFLYYAVENKDLHFMKIVLNRGYFIKTLQKEKEEIFKFNETIKGFVSHVGKNYDKAILEFLLKEKNKINLLSIIKILANQKQMTFINKIKSCINIYNANNIKINIQETEIIQNLIETENLEGLKDLNNILKNIQYNEIYYYLTAVKKEEIIDYVFSLNMQGSKYYNELALSSLVNNTKRFIKFYEKMKQPFLNGTVIAQIIEEENTELLQYLYSENQIELNYEEGIFKNIIYHAIFKNKIKSLKTLITFWDYDLIDYETIKNHYAKPVHSDLESFVLLYREKQQLKKKLEIKLVNSNKTINKQEIKKI